MTAPTLPPHEDDLRTFAADLRAAAVCADEAIAKYARGDDSADDYCAAVERTFAALRKLGHGPKCGTCGGSGRIANDVPCDHCNDGKRLMGVAVGQGKAEVEP